jgi:two-component system chemotaxis sensor kinase CheA
MGDFSLTLTKCEKVALDTAQELQKRIDFISFGGHVQAPKSKILALSDPLLHLIRNSIDHGIEKETVRIQNRKPAVGRLLLKIARDNNHILIHFMDDGAGFDKSKILEKASSLGISVSKNFDKVDANDLFDLVCQPGFSTAQKVSQLSGRGVGLDIVKAVAEELRGDLQVESRSGKGLSFKFKIPL